MSFVEVSQQELDGIVVFGCVHPRTHLFFFAMVQQEPQGVVYFALDTM